MAKAERLPPIAAEKMTKEQRLAAEEFKAGRGYDLLGPFAVMVRSPEVMLRAKAMGDYLRFRNVLPKRVSEMVILLTAREWTQEFEWSHHYKFALEAGLSYNYLPFTALPLYVAIERIDKRVLDAAYDLYATKRQAFLRVILPLTIPGLFAAFLLTFIPALGDYVNQQILGGTNDTMIGTVIQNAFLINLDYAGGSALSAILLAIALVGIFAYARLLGSRTIEEYV